MRAVLPFLVAVLAGAPALALDPVPDEEAKEALKQFEADFRSKDLSDKQAAIYNLHDVPSDLVIRRLERLLRDRDPEVRNVAALAMGGQQHNVDAAGEALLDAYEKEKKGDEDLVISSVLDGLRELKHLGYWPLLEGALDDQRDAVVIRTLDLLGENEDWRAIPVLLEKYKIAMPKRVKWSTGTVNVDTGAAGDADQKAAEAKFNAKYGAGGSKEAAKAKAKAKSFDERNFDSQLRRCVKAITGESFDNALDMQDWYVENYLEIHRKMAEMAGDDVQKILAKAKQELPDLKKEVEEEHRKLEEELAREREASAGG